MLKKTVNYSLIGLIFLFPLFFLPIMTDFYGLPKNFLLIFTAVTLFCLWLTQKIINLDFRCQLSSFDLPVILFGTAVVISTLISSPNKIESLLTPGASGTIIALTLLYFVIKEINNKEINNLDIRFQGPIGHQNRISDSEVSNRKTPAGKHPRLFSINQLLNYLISSAALLSLLSFYQFLGFGEQMIPLDWMKPKFWTPAGSLLALATFLVVGLVIAINQLRKQSLVTSTAVQDEKLEDFVESSRHSDLSTPPSKVTRFLLLLAVVFILLGLSTTLYQLFTTAKPALLPYSAGWQICVEGFKNLKTTLFGVGPGNFLNAFTRFKPLGLNNTNLWNIRFGYSSNFFFQLLTETGLLGLLSFLLIVWQITRQATGDRRHERQDMLYVTCYMLLLLFLFLPPNLLLLFAFFILLGLMTAASPSTTFVFPKNIPPQIEKIFQSKVLVLIPLLLEIVFLFFFSQAVWAEVIYKQALDKATQGRGGDTYNLLIEAIRKNPYRDNFRVSYSQINLALANNWAVKENLTDQDRNTISQLIEQAIREAKAAVSLNPLKVTNWENLALTYRSVINIAQGADQWAVASYNQAISLEPLNPLIRIDLGGVFYAYGNYEQAEKIFERAVELKPDWANARYNLASSLREQQKYGRALQELNVALSLVEPDSNDFQKVNAEIEDLRAKMKPEEKTATPSGQLETLTPPEAAPTGIEPKIELEKEAGPEISPTATPTTAPRVSPTATPTINPTISPTPKF